MDSSDREEFDAQMRKLCAGIGILATDERMLAFWDGLTHMGLAQFVRVVDHMIGEHGPDVKNINVHMLWDVHRDMRRRGTAPGAGSDAAPVKAIASVQEQLCEYAALQLGARLSRAELARPWTYRYREWWVEKTRCAEVLGVEVARDDGTTSSFTVAGMLADTEGHARVMRRFSPARRVVGGVSEVSDRASALIERMAVTPPPVLEPEERIAIREAFSELSPPPPVWSEEDMPEFMR